MFPWSQATKNAVFHRLGALSRTCARADPEQPYSTQFEIKNGGHIFSAYNIGFGCGLSITGPPFRSGFFGFDPKTMKPPDSLGPGKSFTRSCNPQSSSGFLNEEGVDVLVIYRHVPLIPWDIKLRGHFIVKHGSAGYFLVPDVAGNFNVQGSTAIQSDHIAGPETVGDAARPVLAGRDDSAGEYREKSFGLLGGMLVACVIHAERNGKIRIISARKAAAEERKYFDAWSIGLGSRSNMSFYLST